MKKIMILLVAAFIFFSMNDLNAKLPTMVPQDDGSIDFVYEDGPGVESAGKTTCPNPSTIHCHTINSRPIVGHEMPSGTKINLFIHTNEFDYSVGTGYIGATLDEDYDTDIGGDLYFTPDGQYQIYQDYSSWKEAVENYNENH